jgi:Flp pilus assembly pilin Flp
MKDLMKKLVWDESGQDLAEYGIALAVIAGGAAIAAVAIAGFVEQLWTQAEDDISQAAAAGN